MDKYVFTVGVVAIVAVVVMVIFSNVNFNDDNYIGHAVSYHDDLESATFIYEHDRDNDCDDVYSMCIKEGKKVDNYCRALKSTCEFKDSRRR
jgi:hypothetical protein